MLIRWRVKVLAAVLVTLAFMLAWGYFQAGAAASGTSSGERVRYYSQLRIEDGDTLWSLAVRYAGPGRQERKAYIEELKRMNGLASDTIHAGHYLVYYYFVDEGT
ncbi:MAG: LysM peptidoglycan-binding domain-containing protein [Lachnospiraceae bacterium]|jgi:LysM repeat protein|nr:LysM peptidoglycan-binding domain-containing protein [Lachnospiraceae bacterium]